MKKTLRKPENWQDFESLCKKLWGELWGIPNEIKKNGRLGQVQNGIDITGIPHNKHHYFGIQAKGKDDYTNAQLTKGEIDNEISKAIIFTPKLEEFIIATTANKDAKIEQYVREKDLESRQNGNFKILLFCWEDIVDLIESNRETFNWYVTENNFRDNFSIDVFINKLGGTEQTLQPKFQRNIITYNVGVKPASLEDMTMFQLAPFKNYSMFESDEVNLAWCKLDIIIKNSGSKVLEDWKTPFRIPQWNQ